MTINMSNSMDRQRGFAMSTVVMVLLVITAFFTVGMKIGPLYIDHNMITNICQELIDNGQADSMTIGEVRTRVSNSLRINNIRDFDLSNITMTKEDDNAIINIAYERRVDLFGNIDAVATFDTTLQ